MLSGRSVVALRLHSAAIPEPERREISDTPL